MTVIDTSTSEGQLRLLDELARRRLRLQRQPDGTYHVLAQRHGSRDVCKSPVSYWATVAEFPSLVTVAAAVTDLEAV